MNKRWLIFGGGGAAVLLVIILSVAYFVMANQHKPEKTVAAFNEAVKEDDLSTLKEMIEPDEKGAKVNKKSLSAFTAYLKENNESYQVIKDGFKKQIENEDFTPSSAQVSLVSDGKTLGMFPNFKLNVETVNVKVKGAEDDNDISLAIEGFDKPLEEVEEDGNIYGPLIPGEYNVEATVQNELGEFEKDEDTEVWGDTEVSFLIDNEELVQGDENIQKDIVNAANEFNENMSVYVTSGFDTNEFTNVSDELKESLDLYDTQGDFEMIKDYIEKIESQFLKAIVNVEDMDMSQFDGDWQTEISMIVSYDEKMKLEGTGFEDLSHTLLRNFWLVYDADEEKWVVDDVMDEDAKESDADGWDEKEEIEVEDPPVRKWKKDGKDDSFI